MSFLESEKDCHFPIQNIPFGIFSTTDDDTKRIGTAIDGYVLDLSIVYDFISGPILQKHPKIFEKSSLKDFMNLGRGAWIEARKNIQKLVDKNNPVLRDNNDVAECALIPMEEVIMHMPCEIGDYTDFYLSKEHAINIGTIFRGRENALNPNWTHLPVGYHGRASSIVISGTDIRRPNGQTRPDPTQSPIYGPCKLLDFELEMAMLIAGGNSLGDPITIENAEDHIFGFVLMNDWSARDIQGWEYVPLGPFLGKSFGTTISPWVITLEALRPFIVDNVVQNPTPLDYLKHDDPFNFDIDLEVFIKAEDQEESLVCKSNFRHIYWTPKQMIAHHTVNGCNLKTGDLLATGTISGQDETSYGSMMELSWKGAKQIQLKGSNEQRTFLKDGDSVIIRGMCSNSSYSIGFGECTGKVLPANP